LSDLEWLSRIFNDAKRRAVSATSELLFQLMFLYTYKVTCDVTGTWRPWRWPRDLWPWFWPGRSRPWLWLCGLRPGSWPYDFGLDYITGVLAQWHPFWVVPMVFTVFLHKLPIISQRHWFSPLGILPPVYVIWDKSLIGILRQFPLPNGYASYSVMVSFVVRLASVVALLSATKINIRPQNWYRLICLSKSFSLNGHMPMFWTTLKFQFKKKLFDVIANSYFTYVGITNKLALLKFCNLGWYRYLVWPMDCITQKMKMQCTGFSEMMSFFHHCLS